MWKCCGKEGCGWILSTWHCVPLNAAQNKKLSHLRCYVELRLIMIQWSDYFHFGVLNNFKVLGVIRAIKVSTREDNFPSLFWQPKFICLSMSCHLCHLLLIPPLLNSVHIDLCVWKILNAVICCKSVYGNLANVYVCDCVCKREINEELFFCSGQITASDKPEETQYYTLNRKIRKDKKKQLIGVWVSHCSCVWERLSVFVASVSLSVCLIFVVELNSLLPFRLYGTVSVSVCLHPLGSI